MDSNPHWYLCLIIYPNLYNYSTGWAILRLGVYKWDRLYSYTYYYTVSNTNHFIFYFLSLLFVKFLVTFSCTFLYLKYSPRNFKFEYMKISMKTRKTWILRHSGEFLRVRFLETLYFCILKWKAAQMMYNKVNHMTPLQIPKENELKNKYNNLMYIQTLWN